MQLLAQPFFNFKDFCDNKQILNVSLKNKHTHILIIFNLFLQNFWEIMQNVMYFFLTIIIFS